jgi:FkbM family methyltransferase
MRERLRRRLRKRVFRSLSNEVVLGEVARRLNRDAHGADLLAQLVERLHLQVAGELGERLTPVRELDYPRHQIKLVVSSPRIAKRLGSAGKEPFTVEWIEQSVKPGDVFYDIGANVGAYTLIAAKATGNGARVFAFEPSAFNFHDLTRNVLLNDCAGSVVLLPLALWSETGLLSFKLRSLVPGDARHRVTTEPESPSAARLTQTILATRLDDLVERFGLPVPTHAKLDVDGAELDVLRGAQRTLACAEWRSLIVELDPQETDRNNAVKTLLAGHGFGPGFRHERDREAPDVYWSFTRP